MYSFALLVLAALWSFFVVAGSVSRHIERVMVLVHTCILVAASIVVIAVAATATPYNVPLAAGLNVGLAYVVAWAPDATGPPYRSR